MEAERDKEWGAEECTKRTGNQEEKKIKKKMAGNQKIPKCMISRWIAVSLIVYYAFYTHS